MPKSSGLSPISRSEYSLLAGEDCTRLRSQPSTNLLKNALCDGVTFIEIARDIAERKRAEQGTRDDTPEAHTVSGAVSRDFSILVVDNDLGLASNLQDILEGEGYYTAVAHDGEAALALCRARIFDLAIIDMKLPDIAGDELINWLADVCPTTDCILITGNASLESVVEAIRQKSIVAYEVKPLHMERVLAVVSQLVERRQAQEQLLVAETAIRTCISAIATTDLDGKLTYVNPAFLKVWDYDDAEEVLGRTLASLCQEQKKIQRLIQDLPAMSGTEAAEVVVRKKGGREFVVGLRASRIVDGEGQPVGITTSLADITDSKQAAEALRFSDAAFRSIQDSVVACNSEYTITHWNQVSERIYGVKAADAIGKKLLHIIEIVEDSPGQNAQRFKKLESEDHYQEEQLHRTKHAEVWVDISVQAIQENGRRYGWLALATDVTDRKRAEQSLVESQERYEALFDRSLDCVYLHDLEGRFIDANPAALRLLGYEREEIPFLNLSSLLSQDQIPKALETLQELKETGSQKQPTEFRLRRKNGEYVHVETKASVIYHDGKPYAVQGIARDITKRKWLEEKRREVDRMKSEFISNASHELRPPLQSITGLTKLMLKGKVPNPETQKEFLTIVDSQGEHLGRLIDGLLDLSRLESGRFELDKERLPLAELLQNTLRDAGGLADEKSIVISQNIPAMLPEMEVDGHRVRQVVVNLLSNAVKFSPEGSQIDVRARINDGKLLVQVADHGIGIPQKDIPHVFERFYQVNDSARFRGAGLGLYISKQITEAHNGDIWVDSKVGEGSTFSFTLPLNGAGGDVT